MKHSSNIKHEKPKWWRTEKKSDWKKIPDGYVAAATAAAEDDDDDDDEEEEKEEEEEEEEEEEQLH